MQRKLRIGDEEYDTFDSEYLFERVQPNCFSNDVRLISKLLAGHLRRNERYVDMTTFIWTFNMELFEAEKPGQFSLQKVEKNIFQFWAGGVLNPGALENVKGWILKAKQQGWKHYFITDTALNKKFYNRKLVKTGTFFNTEIHLNDQIKELQKLGSNIRDAATFNSKQYQKLQKQTISEGSFAHIPFMSDLARFYMLYQDGGLYLDVDVAPGSVELLDYMTMGNVPYLGPMLRTKQDAIDKGVHGARGTQLERKLLSLFGNRDPGRGMHYMMSAGRSPAMREIYKIANNTNVLGNGAVMEGIRRHFEKNIGLSKLENIMTLTMPVDLPRIEWITDESDNTVN